MANSYAASRNIHGMHVLVEVFGSAPERDRWVSRHLSCDPIKADEARRIAIRSGQAYAHGDAGIPASWTTGDWVWKQRSGERDELGRMAYDLW